MEIISAGEKVKKGKTKFHSKTMCTHSKWANRQRLKVKRTLKINTIKMCVKSEAGCINERT